MNEDVLKRSVESLLAALVCDGRWHGREVEDAMDLCRAAMGDPDAIEYLQWKVKQQKVGLDLSLFLDVLMIEPREMPPE